MTNFIKQLLTYRELIWTLTKTDFKLRYQGSFLGYIWALLKPLLLFLLLNFIFSHAFGHRSDIISEKPGIYALQLLLALVMFFYFAEATNAGLNALKAKAQLVTKIYIPRWTLLVAVNLHLAIIYCLNVSIVVVFFIWYGFMPSVGGLLSFVLFSIMLVMFNMSFTLISAPLVLKVKDLSLVWELVLRLLFYGMPILYPIQILPEIAQKIILLNPVGFIIHFTKEAVINGHYADPLQYVMFICIMIIFFIFSIFCYRKMEPRIAEYI